MERVEARFAGKRSEVKVYQPSKHGRGVRVRSMPLELTGDPAVDTPKIEAAINQLKGSLEGQLRATGE